MLGGPPPKKGRREPPSRKEETNHPRRWRGAGRRLRSKGEPPPTGRGRANRHRREEGVNRHQREEGGELPTEQGMGEPATLGAAPLVLHCDPCSHLVLNSFQTVSFQFHRNGWAVRLNPLTPLSLGHSDCFCQTPSPCRGYLRAVCARSTSLIGTILVVLGLDHSIPCAYGRCIALRPPEPRGRFSASEFHDGRLGIVSSYHSVRVSASEPFTYLVTTPAHHSTHANTAPFGDSLVQSFLRCDPELSDLTLHFLDCILDPAIALRDCSLALFVLTERLPLVFGDLRLLLLVLPSKSPWFLRIVIRQSLP